VNTAPVPAVLHGFSKLIEDDAGNLWAQEYLTSANAPQHWIIFDSVGKPLGRMPIPGGWTLLEIGKDFVLIAVNDSEGALTIERRRLIKSGS
jgi:hypothetical protein